MTKVLIIGSLLLTFFMAGAAERPSIEGKLDQLAEAPAAYQNDEFWVYAVKRLSKINSSADEIQKGGEFVVMPNKKGTRVFRLAEGKRLPITRPGHLPLMLPTTGLQQHISKYYDFPLFVGKKWRAPGFGGTLTSPVNEVTGIETVTTPAGSFQAYKIERVISLTRTSGNVIRHWFTYYYSPQTRSLVKFNYEHNSLLCSVVETTDVELVKYGAEKTSPPKSIDEENFVSAPAIPPEAVTIKLEPSGEVSAPQQQKTIKQPNVSETKKSQEANDIKEPEPIVIAIPKATPAVPEIKSDKPNSPAEVKEESVPKKSASTGALTLTMNIIGQRKETDGGYSEVIVRERSTLRSHDNFQVHLETNRPAYVYILLYDSQGKASQLFPDPKINHSGYTQGERKLVVPDTNMWFWLDENPGTETIFVLASEKPMTEIRSLLARMEKADDLGQQRSSQEIAKRIVGMQRGIGGVTKGQTATYQLSDGSKIQKVTDVVSGAGVVVRGVSFRHGDSTQLAQTRSRAAIIGKTRAAHTMQDCY